MIDWLSQNWTAIATALNIVFAIVTIWLTIVLIKKRKLLYHEYYMRTTVFQTEEAGSELTALYDGEQIHDDVTGVQIAIWNDGDKPIRSEHVLQDAKIVADDDAHILEPRIVERSRDVTGFDIASTSAEEVPLKWDILEKGDGGVVQVLYSGNPDSEFRVDGIVEGQGEIYSSYSEGWIEDMDFMLISPLIIISVMLILIILIYGRIKPFSDMKLSLVGQIIMSSIIVSLPILAYLRRKMTIPTPPFNK